MTKPYFSIITVCRNAAPILEATILSVLGQVETDFEYVIIDGLSTDASGAIIARYAEHIAVSVSEKDGGIYDAMNKGVSLARGSYVMFMNAGDLFEDTHVLQKARLAVGAADILIGDAIVDFGSGIFFHKYSKSLDKIYEGMICSHQAMLVSRRFLQNHPFRLDFKIAADYRQLLDSVRGGAIMKKVDITMARVSAGGISDLRQVETYREYIRAVEAVDPSQTKALRHLLLGLVRISVTSIVKKILPSEVHAYVRRLRSYRASSSR